VGRFLYKPACAITKAALKLLVMNFLAKNQSESKRAPVLAAKFVWHFILLRKGLCFTMVGADRSATF
jgi:hypothetical protein